MDLNFYSELSDTQNVDAEFLNTQAFSGYSEESKVKRTLLIHNLKK